MAQTAFERGEYAKATELSRGLRDRIAEATTVHRQQITVSPNVSVVVVSHQDKPVVAASLRALKEETAPIAAELVFIDNGNKNFRKEIQNIFNSFTYLRPPFNIGASAARNLGVRFSTADIVIFIDDDGIPEPGFVEALLDRMHSSGAAACRGRVLPLSRRAPKPAHYDFGVQCVPGIPNVEGASAWRRELFNRFGGFDLLLSGHEGLKLCGQMFPFFGTLGFLYEPRAVLRHDYASDETGAASKAKRHAEVDEYLEFCGLRPNALRKVFQSTRKDLSDRYLTARWIAAKPPFVASEGRARITALTVAENAAKIIEDYTHAWKIQSCTDFEIVFVDIGSTDGTKAKLLAAWHDDPRFRLIEAGSISRGAALNLALANCRTDLCMISEGSDVSRPDRTSWTLESFASSPNLDCLSFHTFNEKHAFCGELPDVPRDIATHLFLGAPFPFRTFAFRKSAFPLTFDTQTDSSIHYDWFARNFEQRRSRGKIFPLPLVYQRLDSSRNSSNYGNDPDACADDTVYRNFSLVLGPLDDLDREKIDQLMERAPVKTTQELNELQEWLFGFLTRNWQSAIYPADELDAYLLAVFSRIAVADAEELNSGSNPKDFMARFVRFFGRRRSD